MEDQVLQGSPAPLELTAKQWRTVAIASAVLVAVAFQGMTMARNNYGVWRFELTAIELGLALVSSFLAFAVKGLEARGAAWAARYIPSAEGLAYHVLRVLPLAATRAAIMTACLSVVNATVVPTTIYHEKVTAPLLAIPVRFLADIPQAFVICLAVLLVVEYRGQRSKR